MMLRRKVKILRTIIATIFLIGILLTPAYANTLEATQPSSVPITQQLGTQTAQQLGITVYIPPKGFNPLTASNEDLAKYHFPKRPTDPKALASWKTAMEHSVTPIVPIFKDVPIHTHKKKPLVTGGTSANWSGYDIYNGNNYNGYNNVIGNWPVPDATTGDINGPEYQYSCSWVGIGGLNSSELIQAGTEADYYIVPGIYIGIPTYYPWFEVLPKYPTQKEITSFSISPGDQIYTDVSYSNGTAYFYMDDETTNQYTSFSDSGDSSDYDGTVAEWIVERTEVNGSYPSLTDFGSETFTSAYAGSANEPGPYTLNSWPYDSITMSDNNGTTLASPSSLTSSVSFTDYWYNYN